MRISASCFYVNKSYLGWQLRDWNFFLFILKTEDDIRHFVFFKHAECALKNVLRMQSMRGKKCATHGEHALKNVFSHAQPAQK